MIRSVLLFYMFFNVNGKVVFIICCHNVSSLQSESFCSRQPTVPSTVFIYISHKPTNTSHKHLFYCTSKCMHTICSLTHTAKAHTEHTDKWNIETLPPITGIFVWQTDCTNRRNRSKATWHGWGNCGDKQRRMRTGFTQMSSNVKMLFMSCWRVHNYWKSQQTWKPCVVTSNEMLI